MAKLFSTYQTESGDMWDSISFRFYGTEFYSDILCYFNPSNANVWIFDANVTVYIPVINPPQDLPNPPWVQITTSK